MVSPQKDVKKTSTAWLVFDSQRPVSLPRAAELLTAALVRKGSRAPVQGDVALTSLELTTAKVSITLDLTFVGDEIMLAVKMTPLGLNTQALNDLPYLLYSVAKMMPARHVIWAGTDLRIPKEIFVSSLSDRFENDETPGLAIAPRRVARGDAPVTKRPTHDQTVPAVTQVYSAHVMCYRAYLQKSANAPRTVTQPVRLVAPAQPPQDSQVLQEYQSHMVN